MLGLSPIAAATAAETPGTASNSAQERPRIGLALGGGGARGGAHVGVLKVLEELRIPVDCVAGTSMGALVGATFAAGATPDEIDRAIRAINWAATLGGEGQRALTPMQRKQAGITYSNDIEFILRDGRLHPDTGFISSQHVEERLRLLIGQARDVTDFDDLPLPFRAVATDVVASQVVVLEEGDLAEAMRASMAVPGVFAPVLVGDQVLTDGGMMRNLPVDVARALCADVVIAVRLAGPAIRAEELSSLFTVAGRSIDAMILANEQAQLESLTEADVAITVDVGDIGSAEFGRVVETIPLGAEAARDAAKQLSRYSLPEEEYRSWREGLSRSDNTPIRIEKIRFRPLRHGSIDYFATRIEIRPGDQVSLAEIEQDMSRIFASGDFDRVDYRLLPGSGDGQVLEIIAVEKRGTDFMRFDLGLAGSAGGDTLFVLRADHRREWVNALGGQWRNALQLGQLSELETALYQPLDVAQRFYIEPALYVQRSLEDVFDDGDRIARFELTEAHASLDLGMNVSNHARLQAGLRYGTADYDIDIGSPLFDEERSRDSRIVFSGVYDTRDASTLPTRGSYAEFEFTRSGEWLGGEQSYEQLEAVVGHAARLGANVLLLAGGAGWTLDGELPRYRDFRVGGVRSFPAFERGELRGEEYWSASATWLLKLADIQALFGQVFYGGFGLHAINMADRIDQVNEGTIFGLSFTVGARTPAGPLLLSFGVADDDSVGFHIALGRPIAEGSMLDRLH